MLILSRKIGQELILRHESFGEIVFHIADISGHRVRVGVCAPTDVKILRKELTDNGESNANRSRA